MDDIKVGDPRRYPTEPDRDHKVINVAYFAVEIRYVRGGHDLLGRPHYDNHTEPVPPPAPTFEPGDVVAHKDGALHVVTGIENDVSSMFIGPDGHPIWYGNKHFTPTGHKVATVDEGLWFTIWFNGAFVVAADRQHAERDEERFYHCDAIATIRDGLIVQPVTHDGVEHFVRVRSEPRP